MAPSTKAAINALKEIVDSRKVLVVLERGDAVTWLSLRNEPSVHLLSVDQLNTLWGLKVVVTDAMAENTALVGDFRYAMRWAREGVSISISDSHDNFFIRNMLAILAERRDAFGVLDVQAFCEVTAI